MLDLHPFVVHFAVALLCVSVLFDILSVTTERPHLQTVGWWNLFLGFLASLFAVITGLYAKNNGIFPSDVHSLLSIHQYLGIGTAGVFTILFIWRSVLNRKIPGKQAPWYLTVAVIGVIVLITTGFIGGQMVFEHGANVEKTRVLEHQIERLQQQVPVDSVQKGDQD